MTTHKKNSKIYFAMTVLVILLSILAVVLFNSNRPHKAPTAEADEILLVFDLVKFLTHLHKLMCHLIKFIFKHIHISRHLKYFARLLLTIILL